MRRLLRLLLAAGAGVLAGAGFEPIGWHYLLPVAVAALFLLVRGGRLRRGFLLGTVFGAAFMLTLLPWLQVIGVDAWLALSVFEGLFYGMIGLASIPVQRLPPWPVWGACLWCGAEYLRGTVPFGGFPWGRLAFATVDTPVEQLFPYVGAAGVTFAVALVGASLAWAVLRLRRTPVRAVAVLGACLAVVSAATVFPWDAAPSGRTVRITAVQGNVPGEGMEAFAERRAVLNNHVAATLSYARRVESGEVPPPDVVIWPENSTDIDPFSDPSVYADIQSAVDAVGVPVLVGAMVDGKGPREVFNQGIVWKPRTGPAQRYSKMHPVPFGEYIPFRDVLAQYFERLDQIPRDMTPGTRPGRLDINGVPIGDVICFEVAYDGLVRRVVQDGAGVLVVQTNNATYMGTGQVEQQFDISRLRALETGRTVVVAATNGVSGFVGPDGEVVERAPTRTTAVLSHEVRLGQGLTPAVRWGAWIEAGLALAGLAAFVVGLVSRRRRKTPRMPADAA